MLIIGTVGINTREKTVLRDIINQGVNVLRLNFSHSDIKEFNEIVKYIRDSKNGVHIMQDLSGGKVRVSNCIKSTVKIIDKEKVVFSGENNYKEVVEKNTRIKVIPLNIDSKELLENSIKRISMKDNTMQFKILSRDENGVKAEVLRGGVVRAYKGCNIVGIDRSEWRISAKDKKDLIWGLNNNVDIISQSFVENKNDVIELKKYILMMKKDSMKMPKIYAKIETQKGFKNINEIVNEVEGIIVARGDLVPETSIIDVPIIQEKIIRIAKKAGKDIIVGTHILDNMKEGRATSLSEVESIYSNIRRGVDGFLLAGETSVGKMPIKTVRYLNNLIKRYRHE